MYQYFKLAFEKARKKEHAKPCQNIDRTPWSNGIVERSKLIQIQTLHATSRGQRSDPMTYRHRQNDRILAQWCWGYSGAAIIFQGVRTTLDHTPVKCSVSTCAHWRPRWPPSLPMPRNGTASTPPSVVAVVQAGDPCVCVCVSTGYDNPSSSFLNFFWCKVYWNGLKLMTQIFRLAAD